MTRMLAHAALGLILLGALASPAAAAPQISAHRGGSVLFGVPTFPENSLPAFQAAAARGDLVELDVKLTADRVPVVIHDDTLDRTATCAGAVGAFTAAQLRERCRLDELGSPGTRLGSRKIGDPTEPVPTLAEAMAVIRATGATVIPEIKNLPNDNDYDPTPGYAQTIADALAASGVARERIIVQSFLPSNLDNARPRIPGAPLSFLTLEQGNAGGAALAATNDYQWVSPGGAPDKASVDQAHGLGLKVIPYTLNTPDEVRAASDAGVDALITDDPLMARQALGLLATGSGPSMPPTGPTSGGPAPPVTGPPVPLVSRRAIVRGRRMLVTVRCVCRGSIRGRGLGRARFTGTQTVTLRAPRGRLRRPLTLTVRTGGVERPVVVSPRRASGTGRRS